ncbi:PREDICTED: RNA exonuclease 4 isoform X1 [Polistes dominula]|uniref:RNA exonuclease 4 n=2 Tax=Polistes dominula TaxID=743375 RepID=A0ABM1IXJ2_POLDO|nr:PREDICTED: RNA exonuclease 4 isoform X1 [Polistes dominula]
MIIFILIAIFLVLINTLLKRLGKLHQNMNDLNMLYQKNKFMERNQENTGTSIKPKTKRSASGSNWETYKDIIYKEELNRDKKKNNNSTTEFFKKPQKYRKFNQGNAMNKIVNCDPDMAENKKKITKFIAMDCEMVGIGDGRESMVARVSIVNKFGHCLYDKYVKPRERIKDYRTAVSGIYPHHLKSGEDFATVQKEVAEMLKGRILVGHALKHDLAVLFLSHPCRNLRDTSRYKLFKDIIKSKTPSLKRLALELLGIEIQIGEHDSVEDARVAMQLYMLYRNRWESEIYSKR